MGLSAEKREEPFAFLRLFPLAPADRGHVRDRSVPGTGTLPDAGGAGGGGNAPRCPRLCNVQEGGNAPSLPLDGNGKTTGTVHKNKYRLTR